SDFFSVANGIDPKEFGITYSFYPEEECVKRICDSLQHALLGELVSFPNGESELHGIRLPDHSRLSEAPLRNFVAEPIMTRVRIAGWLHRGQFRLPSGNDTLYAGDTVYLSGKKKDLDEFYQWAGIQNELYGTPNRRILIAGATKIGELLIAKLQEEKFDVRLIEADTRRAHELMDRAGHSIFCVNGDPNQEAILREAGVEGAWTFIAVQDDDENNILSSALAKKLGAIKSVALTKKPEYASIVPRIDLIDASINYTRVSVNSVLQHLPQESGVRNVFMMLQQCDNSLYEIEIHPGSIAVGKDLATLRRKFPMIVAQVHRGTEWIAPSGSFSFQEGDVAYVMIPEGMETELIRLMGEK
ncbi:MAG: hypothetical protein D6820_06150, partial [Lentisphaerae bacterium]